VPRNDWRRLIFAVALPHALGVGLFCAPARAQVPPDAPAAQAKPDAIADRAKALMRAGQFGEACSLLRQTNAGFGQDPAILFLLGQCTYALGRYAEAISYYRALLVLEPDTARVRAELGKAYLADKQLEAARKEFEAVLASDPPAQVRADMLSLMAAAQQPKHWSVRMTVGYLYDSNVNAGPNSMSVQLFGIPFELTPGSAPQSDHGVRGSLAAAHIAAFSANAAWQSEVSVDSTDYRNLNAFDYIQFTALTGPKWRGTRQLVFVPFSAEYSQLGHHKYSEAYGVSPQFEQTLTDRFSVKGGLNAQHRVFQIQPDRSGTTWAAQGALKRSGASAGDTVELGYRHVLDQARVDFLRNHSDWLSLAYAATWSSVSVYVEPAVGWIRYREKEAVFDAARKDKRTLLTVNLASKPGKDALTMAIGISINQYDRRLVTVQITCAF
jgi:tetratricopeptide (TPR) repeat protein